MLDLPDLKLIRKFALSTLHSFSAPEGFSKTRGGSNDCDVSEGRGGEHVVGAYRAAGLIAEHDPHTHVQALAAFLHLSLAIVGHRFEFVFVVILIGIFAIFHYYHRFLCCH